MMERTIDDVELLALGKTLFVWKTQKISRSGISLSDINPQRTLGIVRLSRDEFETMTRERISGGSIFDKDLEKVEQYVVDEIKAHLRSFPTLSAALADGAQLVNLAECIGLITASSRVSKQQVRPYLDALKSPKYKGMGALALVKPQFAYSLAREPKLAPLYHVLVACVEKVGARGEQPQQVIADQERQNLQNVAQIDQRRLEQFVEAIYAYYYRYSAFSS